MPDTETVVTRRPRRRITWPAVPPYVVGVGAAVLVSLLAFPATMVEAALHALRSLALISPMILVALILTATATATGSMGLIASSFQGRPARMIVLSSLVGALTPVCGVTVWPLVAGLLAARVPLAPIMAFWLSSPITSPDMLVITAATLGVPFAVGKTVGAVGCGLVGGLAVVALTRLGYLREPAKKNRLAGVVVTTCASSTVMWRFWRDPQRRSQFRSTAVETARLMLVWLTLAFFAEFFLKAHLPHDWIAAAVGNESSFAIPLAATVGAPIYLDGYAALPLIRGLIEAGMRPDAAMAFLVAGGIVSIWAAIPVYALVRLPVFALYLSLAVSCSMLTGWGYGVFLTPSASGTMG